MGILVIAVSTRDSIIKPESFSSRADNGRGLIRRAMTKMPMLQSVYHIFLILYSKDLLEMRNTFISALKKKMAP